MYNIILFHNLGLLTEISSSFTKAFTRTPIASILMRDEILHKSYTLYSMWSLSTWHTADYSFLLIDQLAMLDSMASNSQAWARCPQQAPAGLRRMHALIGLAGSGNNSSQSWGWHRGLLSLPATTSGHQVLLVNCFAYSSMMHDMWEILGKCSTMLNC